MRHLLLISSLVANAAIVLRALFINPNASIVRELSSGPVLHRVGSVAIIAFLFLIASWPWLLALARISTAKAAQGTIFAIIAPLITLFFYPAIAKAPSEGIGYMIIICFLSAWISYPVFGFANRRI